MSGYRVKQWSPQGLFLEICLQAPALEWKSKNWWHSLDQKCLLYHRKQVKCWATKSQVTSNPGPRKKKNRKLQLINIIGKFYSSQEAHSARTYPGFHSRKQLEVLQLPPDTGELSGKVIEMLGGGGTLSIPRYPPHQHLIHRYPTPTPR